MQESVYEKPELKLVGEAHDIVLGNCAFGGDPSNEEVIGDMEFEAD